jgi:hypothetical protein
MGLFEGEQTRLDRKRRTFGYDGGTQTVFPEEKPTPVPKGFYDRPSTSGGIPWGTIYAGGGFICGLLTFIGSWIYCISTYGYLLGVGLGWLPSAIAALIVGYTWPLLLVIGIAVVLLSS